MNMGTVTYQRAEIPANSEYVVLFDSTRFIGGSPVFTSMAATAAAFDPGPKRGDFAGYKVIATIKNGDQNVSVLEQGLTGNAGTEADWETEAAGTVAVALNTTQPIEWKPASRDFRLLVLAGANNPSALFSTIALVPCSDYGS
jgi:hypothetical protein